MQAEAFEATTGIPLSGHASTQARLPLRFGGLGMSSCESLRLGAFMASSFFALSRTRTLLNLQQELLLVSGSVLTALRVLRPLLAEVPTALQEFIAGMTVSEPLRADPPKNCVSQRFWNQSAACKELSALISALPRREACILTCLSKSVSGAWSALPLQAVGLLLALSSCIHLASGHELATAFLCSAFVHATH